MSDPAAGWFADPEQPERQRYWDGVGWTLYVVDEGAVVEVPLSAPADAPGRTPVAETSSAQTPPPPSSAPVGAPNYPRTLIGRLGLLVIASGSLLAGLSAGMPAARGPVGPATEVPPDALWLGIIGAVVMAAFSAVEPWRLRLWGLGLGAFVTAGIGLAQLRLRQPERWADVDLSDIAIARGGVLLGVAATVALVGLALATFFFRHPGVQGDGVPVPAKSRSALALGAGIVSIVVTVLAPVAAALAQTALDDEARSGDALGGRNRAGIGLALGYAVIVVFAALVIGVFIQALLV